MKKALEILKNIKTQITTLTETPELDEAISELDEAISELEKYVKYKMCEGCKLEHRFGTTCCECSRHCKDYYEPKDNS